ncbi:MAG: TolC family protein [Deltaproteobacteria bacterium]|nr:TolC family protein [Deltaproteobacteria bacterium]
MGHHEAGKRIQGVKGSIPPEAGLESSNLIYVLKRWLSMAGLMGMVLLLWPVSVCPEPLSTVFSLEESIQLAFKESPTLKIAREAILVAELKKKQTQTGFLPKLSAQYSYTYIDKIQTITLPAQDYGLFRTVESTLTAGSQNNYAFYLTLDQPIFTGLALTRTYELAGLGLDVSRIKFDQEKIFLAYKVKEAYWNILRSRKIREVAQQAVLQISDHVRVAKEFYEVGLIPLNDLLKSEVQLADAKQNLIRAENGILLARANFNTLLRISLERETEVQDILTFQPFPNSLETCQAEALQKRPEIKEIETQIEMARKNIQLAQSEYYPQVVLQGRYIKQGDTPSVSGSPYVKSDNWDVAAAMKWNFWDWGRTRYLVQEKTLQGEQVKETFTQVKDLIRLEVKEAFLSLREAEKNIALAEKTIQQAEENFRISQVRYREQATTSLEVLDAQTLLAQAKNNLYQALYAYNLAQSRLQRAMGGW